MDAEERQEARDNEIEVLKAMYMEDYEQTWAPVKNQPFTFRVHVKPPGGLSPDEIHCSMRLEFVLGKKYPNQPPTIRNQKVKGLSDDLLKQILSQLRKSAKKQKGEVMVHKLVMEAEEWLVQHNKELKPFHEQMLDHQTAITKEKAKKEEQQRKETLKRDKIAKKQLQEKISLEMKRKRRMAAGATDLELDDVFSPGSTPVGMAPQNSPPMPQRLDALGPSRQTSDPLERVTRIHGGPGGAGLSPGDLSPLSGPQAPELSLTDEDEEDSEDEKTDEDEHEPLTRYFNDNEAKNLSRYETDFEELDTLGSGGFGVVFKVKNRLDGLIYAVKRIQLQGKRVASNLKMIREVTTIARLQHQYIVRYFHAWIQGSGDDVQGGGASGSGEGQGDDDDDDDDSYSSYDQDDADDWLDGEFSTSRAPLSMRSSLVQAAGAPIFLNRDESIDRAFENASLPQTDSSSESNSSAQYLFIQMEFCAKNTLHDVINRGKLKPQIIWRIFRQIVEAIAFIHKQGTIHRDIKPPNIFIGETDGFVKVGDFGLAMSEAAAASASGGGGSGLPKSPPDANSKGRIPTQDGTHTDIVGTPLYRAPEQEKRGRITAKADMYPLGIIMYEMWHHFDTGMERLLEITKLRETGKVPDSFRERFDNDPDLSELDVRIPDLIEMLIQRDPKQRPSAHELLQSGMIPFEIEDAYVEKALNEVTRDASVFRSRVVKALFSTRPADHIDFTFDSNSTQSTRNKRGPGSIAPFWLQSVQTQVFDRLTRIFRLHGLVEMSTPLLTPRISDSSRKHPVSLLDPMGILVSLPFTLMDPFARHVAQKQLTSARRYCISDVFRQSATGGQPTHLLECHFDLVSSEKTCSKDTRAALDAEGITIVNEVLEDFSKIYGKFNIRISHTSIFDAILNQCEQYFDTPDDASTSRVRNQILYLVSQVGHPEYSWQRIRRIMLYDLNVQQKCYQLLREYVNMKGTCKQVVHKISSAFSNCPEVVGAVEQVRLVFKYLTAFNCPNVIFDCGLVTCYDQCRGSNGLIFQAVVTTKSSPFDVLAQGGRYDPVVERYRPPTSSVKKVSAFGATIAIEKIIASIGSQEFPLASFLRSKTSDASVLLYSLNDSLLAERGAIARMLWQNEIRAEYSLPYPMSSLQDAQTYCKLMGIRWLVNFRKKKFKNQGIVSVNNLFRKRQKKRRKKSQASIADAKSSAKGPNDWSMGGDDWGAETEDVSVKDLTRWLKLRITGDPQSTDGPEFASSPASQTPIVVLCTFTKSHKKAAAITEAKLVLESFIANTSGAIVIVDLPLDVVRNCVTQCLPILQKSQGLQDEVEKFVSTQQNKYRDSLSKLVNHISDRMLEKQVKHLFIYALHERSFDMASLF